MYCRVQKTILLIFWITLVAAQSGITMAVFRELSESRWVRTPLIRVVVKSTADWVKVMFDDDQDGTNQNGIRIVSVLRAGWQIRGKPEDEITITRKALWHDIRYNTTVEKFGDMVAFNKGPNDFNYTVMYADLTFEVDTSLSTGYIWLMLAGQGVTNFELTNREKGYVFWRETLVGSGHTSHVRRNIMIESFFRTWDVSEYTILTLIACTLLVTFAFSPLRRVIRSKVRWLSTKSKSIQAENSEIGSAEVLASALYDGRRPRLSHP